MAGKLPALRLLERRGIPYELFTFDDAIRSAAGVAAATDMPPDAVYKTLVVESERARSKPWLFLLPADSEADLKALAQALGVKKVRMASQRDAERITGLKVGGISALALTDKGFPVLIDVRALSLDRILVSAGERGADVRLAVADFVALTGAVAIAGCTRGLQ